MVKYVQKDTSGLTYFSAAKKNNGITIDPNFDTISNYTVEQYLAKQDSLPEDQKYGMLKRFFSKKTLTASKNGFDFSKNIRNI